MNLSCAAGLSCELTVLYVLWGTCNDFCLTPKYTGNIVLSGAYSVSDRRIFTKMTINDDYKLETCRHSKIVAQFEITTIIPALFVKSTVAVAAAVAAVSQFMRS